MYYFLPDQIFPTLLHHINQHFAEYNATGYLSIKCIFNGHAVYELDDGRRFDVHDDGFLILNHDQPYTIYKDWPNPMETFCIAFPKEMVADAIHSSTIPVDRLLDNPMRSVDSITFLERIYPYSEPVTSVIQMMKHALLKKQLRIGQLEEQLYMLTLSMLQTQRNIFGEIEQMPAVRASTRAELYRRLSYARDFIHASLDQTITLKDIAQIAALSPHHFLRVFKQHYGQTPNQYLTTCRINRAKQLLIQSDLPVTTICLRCGISKYWLIQQLVQTGNRMFPACLSQKPQFSRSFIPPKQTKISVDV